MLEKAIEICEELKSARHLMLWNEDLDKLLEILKGSE